MGPSLGEWILSLETGSINGGKGHNLALDSCFCLLLLWFNLCRSRRTFVGPFVHPQSVGVAFCLWLAMSLCLVTLTE